jgi:tripartite-type tricarboxylate transporter receptor subunit TctC
MHPRFFHDPSRRRVVLAARAAASPRRAAFAQGAFPSQPIRIVVPFGPGGLADVTTRLTAQKLGEKLGTQVVIDNRPGAGGIVAAQYVLGAAHDGYTLILFSNGTTIATSRCSSCRSIRRRTSCRCHRSATSTSTCWSPRTAVRRPQVAAGREQAPPAHLGSINPGSTQHLSGELFKSVTQLNAAIVPFKTSGEVQMALQRGDVDVGFESYAALRGGIDAGVLRAHRHHRPRAHGRGCPTCPP